MTRSRRAAAVVCIALLVFAAMLPGVLSAVGAIALVPVFCLGPVLRAPAALPELPAPGEQLLALSDAHRPRPPPCLPFVHSDNL